MASTLGGDGGETGAWNDRVSVCSAFAVTGIDSRDDGMWIVRVCVYRRVWTTSTTTRVTYAPVPSGGVWTRARQPVFGGDWIGSTLGRIQDGTQAMANYTFPDSSSGLISNTTKRMTDQGMDEGMLGRRNDVSV